VKRLHVMAAALVLVAGCRAVLGIEPLDDVDGGTETDGGTVKDATLADTSTDAADASVSTDAADTSAPTDAADTSPPPNPCADAGPNCNMCCRNGSGPAEHLLEQYSIEAGCVCGATTCGPECADGGFCAGQGPPVPMSCGQCVGTALGASSPPCEAAQATCTGDPSCAPVLECLKGCP
jgi:hypothetical protein